MIGKAISNHGFSMFLAFIGAVLWVATGDFWFFVIGIGTFVLATTFKRFFRTILWIALAVYASYAISSGWFIVIVLLILCMSFPILRVFTPVADFSKAKGK